jgi:hypothetical protein
VVELQAFLGLFNYYSRFIPKAARVVRPLTNALQGGLRPQYKIRWLEEKQAAFAAGKAAVSAATQLAHPFCLPTPLDLMLGQFCSRGLVGSLGDLWDFSHKALSSRVML